jgi:hypothetical protein
MVGGAVFIVEGKVRKGAGAAVDGEGWGMGGWHGGYETSGWRGAQGSGGGWKKLSADYADYADEVDGMGASRRGLWSGQTLAVQGRGS